MFSAREPFYFNLWANSRHFNFSMARNCQKWDIILVGWGWEGSMTHIFRFRTVIDPSWSSITADLPLLWGRRRRTFPGRILAVSLLAVEYYEVRILWPGMKKGGFLTLLLFLALSWSLLLSLSCFCFSLCSISPPDCGRMGRAGFCLSLLKANLAGDSSPVFEGICWINSQRSLKVPSLRLFSNFNFFMRDLKTPIGINWPKLHPNRTIPSYNLFSFALGSQPFHGATYMGVCVCVCVCVCACVYKFRFQATC